MMVPEMEKPRVTEIKVRMDCNGCVQKIKKALHGITGIYEIYTDFPQQKITIIGWADPEKIVRAIKKTRKTAVICLHTEQQQSDDQQAQPTEPTPEGGTTEGGEAPPPDPTNPPDEPPHPETVNATPQEQPPPENPPPTEPNPSPEIANATPTPSRHPPKPIDPEEIHVVHHHPPDYGYRYSYGPNIQQGYFGQYNNGYHNVHRFGPEQPQPQPPQPVYVTHSYNAYRPSPNVTEYAYPRPSPNVTEYAYPRPPQMYDPGFRQEQAQPPQPVYANHNYNAYRPSLYVTEYAYPRSPPRYSHYSIPPDYYSRDYYSGNNGNGNGNGNITSMFSEENPNACRIV